MKLSIRTKLLAVFIPAMIGVVGFLAAFFSSRELDTMSADLHRRAAMYGELARGQVASSVAFSDRETAREVLDSLASDADISAVVLYGASREHLYTRGSAEPWVEHSTTVAELDSATVVDTQGHVSALVPIHALEGPRGTLVIQLSTTNLEAQRRHVLITAAAVGAGALAFAAAIAFLIARAFARRLDRIARVARRTASGDMTGVVGDRAGDEIGEAARAFDGMVARLAELMTERELAAQREQERLNALVAARTAELDARNTEMRHVFDHIDQGFMTVALDGTIASERSAAVEAWLGPIENRTFLDYVRAFAPASADWFELSWSQLVSGELPIELCLAQLPSDFVVGERHVRMTFKAITGRILVVASDVTAEVERERANRDEGETIALYSHMLRDRTGFAAFRAEAAQLVASITTDRAYTTATFGRAVHTLKGISALEHVASIAELCHELENCIAETDDLGVARRCTAIAERWRFLMARVEPVADMARESLDITSDDLADLERAIARNMPAAQLAELVAHLRCERVAPRVEHLAEQARALATRLCKDPIEVVVDVDRDLRVPAERWRPVWASLVHAVRNAVDHGIESPAERDQLGKPATARIAMSAASRAGDLVLAIEDSGRGVDWGRVAEVARSRQLPADTHDDLVAAMFSDGVSTRTAVTEISGRGVGLAALRAACDATDGRIAVTSRAGLGTRLEIVWSGAGVVGRDYQVAV